MNKSPLLNRYRRLAVDAKNYSKPRAEPRQLRKPLRWKPLTGRQEAIERAQLISRAQGIPLSEALKAQGV